MFCKFFFNSVVDFGNDSQLFFFLAWGNKYFWVEGKTQREP